MAIYSKYFSIQLYCEDLGFYPTFCVKFVFKKRCTVNSFLCLATIHFVAFWNAIHPNFREPKQLQWDRGWMLIAVYLAYKLKPTLFPESFICLSLFRSENSRIKKIQNTLVKRLKLSDILIQSRPSPIIWKCCKCIFDLTQNGSDPMG